MALSSALFAWAFQHCHTPSYEARLQFNGFLQFLHSREVTYFRMKGIYNNMISDVCLHMYIYIYICILILVHVNV